MNRLIDDYAGRPVVFLESNINDVSPTRMSHFQQVHPQGGRMPFIMVDSGFETTLGPTDFYPYYQSMVEAALAQPAGVELAAAWQVTNNQAQVMLTIQNTSGAGLGAANSAHLHLIAYRDDGQGAPNAPCPYTANYVLGAYEYALSLANGAQASLTKTLLPFPGVPWEQVRLLALVDYLPRRKGAFNSLQAAVAQRSDTPRLTVSPEKLELIVAASQGDPAPQPLRTGGTPGLRWSAAVTPQPVPWLQLAPAQGQSGETLQVQIRTAALADGPNQASLTLSSPENRFPAVQVPVSVVKSHTPVLHLPIVRK